MIKNGVKHCDICKELIITERNSEPTKCGSMYCDSCWINDKKTIELRQVFYTKLILLGKRQEYNKKYKNKHDNDFTALNDTQLRFVRKHTFGKAWIVREDNR